MLDLSERRALFARGAASTMAPAFRTRLRLPRGLGGRRHAVPSATETPIDGCATGVAATAVYRRHRTGRVHTRAGVGTRSRASPKERGRRRARRRSVVAGASGTPRRQIRPSGACSHPANDRPTGPASGWLELAIEAGELQWSRRRIVCSCTASWSKHLGSWGRIQVVSSRRALVAGLVRSGVAGGA